MTDPVFEPESDDKGPSLSALLDNPQEEPEPEENETEPESETEDTLETQATEEEPPEQVSESAQKRFQKLANKARAASQENQELKRLLSQQAELISTLKEDTGLRKQQWDVQQSYLKQQQQAMQPEQRKRAMLMAGLDPTETFHQFMYDQFEENQVLKHQLKELNEKFSGVEQERFQDRFSRSVESSIRQAVQKYDVDEDALRDLVENAKEIAIAKGMDPDSAAKTTIQRVSRFMRPKVTKRLTQEEREVHNLISTSGRTGGETAGSSPRRSKPKTFEDALKALGR